MVKCIDGREVKKVEEENFSSRKKRVELAVIRANKRLASGEKFEDLLSEVRQYVMFSEDTKDLGFVMRLLEETLSTMLFETYKRYAKIDVGTTYGQILERVASENKKGKSSTDVMFGWLVSPFSKGYTFVDDALPYLRQSALFFLSIDESDLPLELQEVFHDYQLHILNIAEYAGISFEELLGLGCANHSHEHHEHMGDCGCESTQAPKLEFDEAFVKFLNLLLHTNKVGLKFYKAVQNGDRFDSIIEQSLVR